MNPPPANIQVVFDLAEATEHQICAETHLFIEEFAGLLLYRVNELHLASWEAHQQRDTLCCRCEGVEIMTRGLRSFVYPLIYRLTKISSLDNEKKIESYKKQLNWNDVSEVVVRLWYTQIQLAILNLSLSAATRGQLPRRGHQTCSQRHFEPRCKSLEPKAPQKLCNASTKSHLLFLLHDNNKSWHTDDHDLKKEQRSIWARQYTVASLFSLFSSR